MKRKLLFAIAAFLCSITTWAQTDVTSTYIINAGFENSTARTSNLAASGTAAGEDYESSGWKLAQKSTWSSSAVVAYGGSGQVNGASAPSADNDGNSGKTLGVSVGWSGTNKYQSANAVTLPAGAYTLTVHCYNAHSKTQFKSLNGFIPTSGSSYISTKTTFTASTWENDVIEFTLNEETEGKFQIGGQAVSGGSGDNAKVFFDNITLIVTPFATADDYSNLNKAISTVEGKAWGFDAGEYAPYNYVEVIEALAAANAIDQTVNNSQATVQALTATLNTTMTANAADVNAIWDPSFEHEYSTSGNVQPIAWTGTTNHNNATDVRWMWNVSGNAGLNATSSTKALFTKYGVYYGQQEGYTLPLNADTYYTIGFVYGGWSDCKKDGYVTMSDPNSTALSLIPSNRLPLDAVDGNSNTASWKNYQAFFKTNAAGNYVLGLRKDNENQQSQYVYGDFVLKQTTVAEATDYYNAVKDEVDDSYDASANGGSEKTDFKAAIDASVPSTVAEIIEAAANLYTLRDAFVSATPKYDAYLAEKANAERIAASITSGVSAPTTAAEAETALQTILVNEYNYVASNFNADAAATYGITIDRWTGTATSGGNSDTPQTKSNEKWGTTATTYYEQGSKGWGSNAWTLNYTKTVTLPANTYVMKVAARASTGATATLKATIGGTTITESLPNVGNTGLGITTDGVASFDGNDTFANSDNGYGWQWRYLAFTLENDGEVTLQIDASANTINQWCSFGDVAVVSNVSTAAMETAYNNFTMQTLGFENGQYAPYNNVAVLEAYAQAKAIVEGTAVPSTQVEVDAITATLTTPTWTANDGDVDAIFNGSFSSTVEGDWGLTAWTRTNGWGQQQKNLSGDFVTAYYNQPGSLQYGNQGVYTMPLAANQVYKLTFSYRSHENNSNTGVTASVLNGEAGMAAVTFSGNGSTSEWKTVSTGFTTGAAGDYVLTLANNGNTWITGVSLVKTQSATVNMNVKANKYGTFIAPFDVTIPEGIEAYTIESISGSALNLTEVETTISANTPVILKNTTGDEYNHDFTGASLAVEDSYTADYLTGVYTAATIAASDESDTRYVLQTQESVQAFYKVDAAFTATANRCYLTVPVSSGVKAFYFDIDGETGLENLNVNDNKRDEAIFNLAGQRVAKAQKGLYIVNGKKVVVK